VGERGRVLVDAGGRSAQAAQREHRAAAQQRHDGRDRRVVQSGEQCVAHLEPHPRRHRRGVLEDLGVRHDADVLGGHRGEPPERPQGRLGSVQVRARITDHQNGPA